jgi:hypothetical protein
VNTIYNLLKEDSVGCGTVTGADTGLANEITPSDSFKKFMEANTETMTETNIGTDLFAFYKSTNI